MIYGKSMEEQIAAGHVHCISFGGGGTSGSSNPDPALSKIAQSFFTETEPLRSEFTNQLLQLLQTGGTNARVPIIEKSVEATRKASSDALGATQTELARSGLAGTPFGENVLATQTATGEQAAAKTKIDLLRELLAQVSGYTLGTGNVAISGLSGARTSEQGGSQFQVGLGQNCCFIFIAAHGFLHPVVRLYRDEHLTIRNRRGYYWLADRLVPWMKRSPCARALVKWLMVAPMTEYGKFHYHVSRVGWIFWPVTKAWLATFTLLGLRPPYRRANSEEVV